MTSTSRHHAEIVEALRAAGCGILRRPIAIPAPRVPAAKKLPDTAGRRDMRAIRDTVAAVCSIDAATLIGVRRAVPVCRARHIFYFVARELNGASLSQIGKACGHRDHTTVLHGIRKVEADRAAFEPELGEVLRWLKQGEA